MEANTPDTAPKIISNANNKRPFLKGNNKPPKMGPRKKARLPPIVTKAKYVVFKWTGAILAFKACIFGTPIASPEEIKIAAQRHMHDNPENVNSNKPMT